MREVRVCLFVMGLNVATGERSLLLEGSPRHLPFVVLGETRCEEVARRLLRTLTGLEARTALGGWVPISSLPPRDDGVVLQLPYSAVVGWEGMEVGPGLSLVPLADALADDFPWNEHDKGFLVDYLPFLAR